jgi:hypothetical protein
MPDGGRLGRRSRDQDDIHMSLRGPTRPIAAIPRISGTASVVVALRWRRKLSRIQLRVSTVRSWPSFA